jgi:hypothetical protein
MALCGNSLLRSLLGQGPSFKLSLWHDTMIAPEVS